MACVRVSTLLYVENGDQLNRSKALFTVFTHRVRISHLLHLERYWADNNAESGWNNANQFFMFGRVLALLEEKALDVHYSENEEKLYGIFLREPELHLMLAIRKKIKVILNMGRNNNMIRIIRDKKTQTKLNPFAWNNKEKLTDFLSEKLFDREENIKINSEMVLFRSRKFFHKSCHLSHYHVNFLLGKIKNYGENKLIIYSRAWFFKIQKS